MSEMTSRQRLLTAYRLEEPDTVPVSFHMTEEWMRTGDQNIVHLIMKEADPCVLQDLAGMDGCRAYLGDVPIEKEKTFKEGYEYVRYKIDTPKGALRSFVKLYPELFGAEWKIEPFVKDDSDLEKFLSIPYRPFKPDPKPYHDWKRRLGEKGVVLHAVATPIYLPAFLMKLDKFLITCMRKPDLIKEIERVAVERVSNYIEYLSKIGVDIFWLIGSEFLSATMAHPKLYEDLVLPYDRKVVDAIHDAGAIAYIHMHGKVGEMLEKISDTGTDVLDPLEPPPRGSIDLADAKRRIGDRVCLVGNIDQVGILGQRDLKIVEKKCMECIRSAAEGGGYVMMGTGPLGEVRPSIPYENIRTMIKTARDRGKYPLDRSLL